jgi:ADP-heptose:LPS heptosyltransferase
VDPPVGLHQAAWLAGGAWSPDTVQVPLLSVMAKPDAPQVLLFPGSGGLRKCWPSDHYADLGRRLTSRGLDVAVVLGPVELDRGPGPERFTGLRVFEAPGLAETAALCAGAEIVVGNDAGTTHLAAAVGARGLVLFGPTDPVRWRPLGDRFSVLGPDLSALTVAVVMAAVVRL